MLRSSIVGLGVSRGCLSNLVGVVDHFSLVDHKCLTVHGVLRFGLSTLLHTRFLLRELNVTDAASCGGGILRRVRLLEGAQIECRSQDLLLALDVAVGGLVGVEVERLTAALVYDLRVLEYLDTHVSAFGHALHLSLEVGDLLVLTLELHILHIAIAMLLLLLVQISKLHAIVAVALRIR